MLVIAAMRGWGKTASALRKPQSSTGEHISNKIIRSCQVAKNKQFIERESPKMPVDNLSPDALIGG